MQSMLQDFRYGLRMLAKAPGFTAVAVLTLALGIGATVVMFSVIYNVVLNPFPYKDVNRSIVFGIADSDPAAIVPYRTWLYIPEFIAFKEQNNVFEDLVGWRPDSVYFSDGKETHKVDCTYVTTDTFDFLGVPPLLGRGLKPDDMKPGAPQVFVMNFKFWKSQLGGDPRIVGKTFVLNDKPRTLIGVMPPRFQFGDGPSVWLPMGLYPGAEGSLNGGNLPSGLSPIGRLKPEIGLKVAEADLNVIAGRIAEVPTTTSYLPFPRQYRVPVDTLTNATVGNFKATLYALLGAVLMLLLIACSNVANLLLARATVREREIAIRASLGASRSRLIRQLLTESSLLAVAGCVLGSGLAYVGLKGVVAMIPQDTIPSEAAIALNPAALWFDLGLTALTALLCGLAPALRVVRGDLHSRLMGSGKGTSAGFRHGKVRAALVVTEVALSLVLLTGAGLMMRTLFALAHVNLGFKPKNLLVVEVVVPRSQFETARNVIKQVLERVKALPGVKSAATGPVPTFRSAFPNVKILGRHQTGLLNAMYASCGAGYFDTLGRRLLRGRPFSEGDLEAKRWVTVVNDTFVRQYFGNEDPIGQKINLHSMNLMPYVPHDAYFEIIGVVADVQTGNLREPPAPEVLVPYSILGFGGGDILVRTRVDPKSLVKGITQVVWAVDPLATVDQVGPFEELLAGEYTEPQFEFSALGSFAGLGLLLVVAGVFSVMAYTVSLQRHEIGIRMALGAQQVNILRMVLLRGCRLVLVGIVIGVLVSLQLTRFIASQIWGVAATDPTTMASVALLLMLVALAACWIPARRAMRVEPMEALRYE